MPASCSTPASSGPRPADGSAAISAFALESEDPAAVGRPGRPTAGPAPAPHPRHGRSRPDRGRRAGRHPDLLLPDREPAGPHGWLGDFLATGNQSDHPAGITGIDHLSLAQPFDRFDEAALFYRSCSASKTTKQPSTPRRIGLVRSLAVHSRGARVRLALSVPLLRRGEWAPGSRIRSTSRWRPATSSATSAAAAAAGAPLLPIPANYYDDLEARLGAGARAAGPADAAIGGHVRRGRPRPLPPAVHADHRRPGIFRDRPSASAATTATA